jgi:hypothetical protein
MNTVQLKNTALHLRRSGLSYSEILKQINVPKSTLAYWLRGMSLEEDQESSLRSRVVDRQKRGRFSTAIALRARRVYREKAAFEEAQKDFHIHVKNTAGEISFFLTGISLYLAQGSKKSGYFQFIHSDQDIMTLMIVWVEKFLNIPRQDIKYRVFVDEAYKDKNIPKIWANILGIRDNSFQKTTYLGRKTQKTLKRSSSYKGSLCVTITSVAVLRRVIAWQNLLIKYYRETGIF